MLDVQKLNAGMLVVTEAYRRLVAVEQYFEENEVMTREVFLSMFEDNQNIME